MVTQTATKSKKASSKIVKVIARYLIKRNNHVCYLVRSSDGKGTYCTTLDNHGHATGCTCPARKPCYHMLQLEALESERQPHAQEPELAYAPAVGGCYSFRAPVVTLTQAMAEAQQVPAPAPVEQEMHTPVFTIDDAMDMAQFAMEYFDSCAMCGCRVKAGQNYCARC